MNEGASLSMPAAQAPGARGSRRTSRRAVVVWIAGIWWLAPRFDSPPDQALAIACCILATGALQVVVQWPILRREGYPNPYDKLKQFSRGKGQLKKEDFEAFITQLDVSENLKEELFKITPFSYTGI